MMNVANKHIMLSLITLSVIMLSAIMPSVIMLSVIMLNVVMPSVVMLSVVAPSKILIIFCYKDFIKVQSSIFHFFIDLPNSKEPQWLIFQREDAFLKRGTKDKMRMLRNFFERRKEKKGKKLVLVEKEE
jgi:hypothetical protein